MKKLEFMNIMETHTYYCLHDLSTNTSDVKVDGFIYLRTTPKKCLERINKKRESRYYTEISLYYLKALHDNHENYFLGNDEISVQILYSDLDDNFYSEKTIYG